MRRSNNKVDRSRELRRNQTAAEGLLWSLLRAKQVCGLKFRRQHPVGPYFPDFTCVSHRLIVELDGEYHVQIPEEDLRRQRFLEAEGWKVIRFVNDDVMEDAEAVLRAIAEYAGEEYHFQKRSGDGSGMMSDRAPHGPQW